MAKEDLQDHPRPRVGDGKCASLMGHMALKWVGGGEGGKARFANLRDRPISFSHYYLAKCSVLFFLNR